MLFVFTLAHVCPLVKFPDVLQAPNDQPYERDEKSSIWTKTLLVLNDLTLISLMIV